MAMFRAALIWTFLEVSLGEPTCDTQNLLITRAVYGDVDNTVCDRNCTLTQCNRQYQSISPCSYDNGRCSQTVSPEDLLSMYSQCLTGEAGDFNCTLMSGRTVTASSKCIKGTFRDPCSTFSGDFNEELILQRLSRLDSPNYQCQCNVTSHTPQDYDFEALNLFPWDKKEDLKILLTGWDTANDKLFEAKLRPFPKRHGMKNLTTLVIWFKKYHALPLMRQTLWMNGSGEFRIECGKRLSSRHWQNDTEGPQFVEEDAQLAVTSGKSLLQFPVLATSHNILACQLRRYHSRKNAGDSGFAGIDFQGIMFYRGFDCRSGAKLTGKVPDLTLTLPTPDVTSQLPGIWRLDLTNKGGTGSINFLIVVKRRGLSTGALCAIVIMSAFVVIIIIVVCVVCHRKKISWRCLWTKNIYHNVSVTGSLESLRPSPSWNRRRGLANNAPAPEQWTPVSHSERESVDTMTSSGNYEDMSGTGSLESLQSSRSCSRRREAETKAIALYQWSTISESERESVATVASSSNYEDISGTGSLESLRQFRPCKRRRGLANNAPVEQWTPRSHSERESVDTETSSGNYADVSGTESSIYNRISSIYVDCYSPRGLGPPGYLHAIASAAEKSTPFVFHGSQASAAQQTPSISLSGGQNTSDEKKKPGLPPRDDASASFDPPPKPDSLLNLDYFPMSDCPPKRELPAIPVPPKPDSLLNLDYFPMSDCPPKRELPAIPVPPKPDSLLNLDYFPMSDCPPKRELPAIPLPPKPDSLLNFDYI